MQTSAKCMSQGQEVRGMFPLLVWAPFGSPAQSLPPSDVGRLAVKSCILQDLPAVSLSRIARAPSDWIRKYLVQTAGSRPGIRSRFAVA